MSIYTSDDARLLHHATLSHDLHSKVCDAPRVLLNKHTMNDRPRRCTCDKESRQPRMVSMQMVIMIMGVIVFM